MAIKNSFRNVYGVLLVLGVLILPVNVLAQKKDIPRDTSYTLRSALEKIRKSYPDVTAVYSNPSPSIIVNRDLVYRSLGDRTLLADLFYSKAKGQKQAPGVLLIHGGGWRTGNKSLMSPLAEKLADAGYVVMTAEYRLSSEASYPAAVDDLYQALDWMIDHAGEYAIDTNNLVVMGCSAGGQLAALIGTTYNKPDIFNEQVHRRHRGHISAIVDIDGILAFRHPDSQEGTMASQWLGGTYEEKPEVWKEASALYHVDGNTPPTLFLASMYPRFLAGREDYCKALKPFGTKTETKFFEQAPHSFWLVNPWFEPTVQYVLTFLDEVLP